MCKVIAAFGSRVARVGGPVLVGTPAVLVPHCCAAGLKAL